MIGTLDGLMTDEFDLSDGSYILYDSADGVALLDSSDDTVLTGDDE